MSRPADVTTPTREVSSLALEAIVAHTKTNSAEHQYMLYLLRRAEENPARLADELVSVEANLCAIIARRSGAL